MRLKTINLSFLALLLIAVAIAVVYATRNNEYKSDQFLMDTLISIRVYGKDSEKLKIAVREAYAEMRRIAELADHFPEPGSAAFQASDICRVNTQAGSKPVRVSAEVFEMLEMSKQYTALTNGAFDITIGPVMDLWGFGGKNPAIPQQARLDKALQLVDSNSLILDRANRTVFLKKPGMKLDLGAIAKGYATEKALQVLRNHGITTALIDAGGNIRVLGRSPRNSPWKIGVKAPRKADEIAAVLSIEDSSAVTSGDYYRFFEAGGKRMHHILDPRTGYPAGHSMSVTVVTKDAGVADILSTAFFVLEPGKALQLAARLGVELLIITADGQIMQTPGLGKSMRLVSSAGTNHEQGR